MGLVETHSGADVEEAMDRIQRLVEQLGSPDKNKRYEACEYLRITPELPEFALTSLQRATSDPDPEVADAAQRAFELHAEAETGINVHTAPVVLSFQPSREQRRGRSIILIGIGTLMLALGAGFCLNMEAAIGLFDRAMGPNPQCSWPSARGSIMSSDLQNHVRLNGEDDWQFTVGFEYEAGYVHHWNQQQIRQELVVPSNIPKFAEVPYLFTACEQLPNRAEAIVLFRAANDGTQFFPGRPVLVYFDPLHTEEAVIVPGLIFGGPISYGEVAMITGSIALPIAGVVVWLLGVSKLSEAEGES